MIYIYIYIREHEGAEALYPNQGDILGLGNPKSVLFRGFTTISGFLDSQFSFEYCDFCVTYKVKRLYGMQRGF